MMKHHFTAVISSFIASVAITATATTNTAISADRGMAQYVYPGNATAKVAPPEYLPDGETMVRLSDDSKRIIALDPQSGKETETLLDLGTTRENSIDDIDGFTISPDGSKIMVWNERRPIYRRSFKARYWVYDRHSRILRPLVEGNDDSRQRAPIFSPDGRMVAYVDATDNNIYVKKLDYNTVVAVTTDGAINRVINGVPDWTYEEEFTTSISMTWAPDNLTLCFLKYNEADVPLYHFAMYEGACDPNPEYALYPGLFEYKYPVAGMTNSKVTLHSYDIETRKLKEISFNDRQIEYIPRIEYAYAPDRLIVTTLNRDQNRMEIYSVNPRSTTSRSLLVEENKTGWIQPESYEMITFTPEFFVIMSSRSGYTHLYQYSYSGALERTLTSGDYEVTTYYGYNSSDRCHYYQSTSTGAENRVISRIDNKGNIRDISPANGTADAWFNPSMRWMMMRFSDINTPPRFTLHNTSKADKTVRVLEDNAAAATTYASAPRREFFTIDATSDAPSLKAYMIKPAGFDPTRRYPVIMFQYSGPGSQEVRNRWSIDWETYFAIKGYLIVCVDGRGTGARGKQFREAVYRDLGHYETIDQIRGARYVGSLPYVDSSRIGIFGWSYGGYETIMAVSASESPYRAAVAVAPVTDWRYYDTVYAERYMLTPAQNEAGYKSSSAINAIPNMNTRLLIMHGTADDNVHLSNTMEYVAQLVAAGKFCDLMLFPNMNHSINGCDTRLMVYSRMLDYFNRNL